MFFYKINLLIRISFVRDNGLARCKFLFLSLLASRAKVASVPRDRTTRNSRSSGASSRDVASLSRARLSKSRTGGSVGRRNGARASASSRCVHALSRIEFNSFLKTSSYWRALRSKLCSQTAGQAPARIASWRCDACAYNCACAVDLWLSVLFSRIYFNGSLFYEDPSVWLFLNVKKKHLFEVNFFNNIHSVKKKNSYRYYIKIRIDIHELCRNSQTHVCFSFLVKFLRSTKISVNCSHKIFSGNTLYF